MARQPEFLARQSYRRRRLIDAARLLPFFGGVGFFLPILWQAPGTAAPGTARAGIMLFAIWLALIVAALGLSRRLRDTAGETDGPSRPGGDARGEGGEEGGG